MYSLLEKPLGETFGMEPHAEDAGITVDLGEDPAASGITENEDGSVDVGPQALAEPEPVEHSDNLAEYLEDEDLHRIAQDVKELFDQDKASRSEWDKAYEEGLQLLGLKQEPRTVPFKDSCGAVHPVLLESIVRFSSNAAIETLPASGPVDTKVVGAITEESTAKAARVRDYMNYVVTEKMLTFREDQEQLYFELGYCGAGFKKYYTNELGEPDCKFIPASDIACPYGFSNIEEQPRVACTYKMSTRDMEEAQMSGRFIDVELGPPTTKTLANQVQNAKDAIVAVMLANTDSAFYDMIESHLCLNLPKFNPDGQSLPYIVTIEAGTEKVLSIRRNWTENDPKKRPNQYFVDYKFIHGPGFMGYGLLHLIGGLARSATSVLRQLVDSGTFANMQGGFYTGLRLKNDQGGGVAPGEWRFIDTTAVRLQDAFLPLPTKEPSSVLFQLLGTMVEDARKLGFITDADINVGSDAAVGTTVAILERQLKVISAVQARIYRSMAREFKILKRLIKESVACKCGENGQYDYDVEGGQRSIKVQDFDDSVNVVPVADPNAATFGMQMIKYQLAMQLAQQFPKAVDQKFLVKEYLRFAGVRGVDMIVPKEEHIPVRNAAEENSAMLTGQPVKAFPWQAHEQHLAAHLAFLNSPENKAFLGQIPTGPQIIAAGWEHAMQHVAFKHYQDIQHQLGAQLPPMGEPIPSQIEADLS